MPLDDTPWDVAGLIDGEQRIEADRKHKLARTTLSMTGSGVRDEDGKATDMEIDANKDVVSDVLRRENIAFVMAKHADPDNVPDSPDDWLEQFGVFSIYEILPELIALWGMNMETQAESKKNIARLTVK